MTLDLAVYPGASGLNESQKGQVYGFLRDYKSQSSDRLLIRAPSGGPNETAAMRAYDQVRKALRSAGIDPKSVVLEPYFGNGDPSAPLRLSYLQFVASAAGLPGLVGECRPRSAKHALSQHGLRHPAQSRGDGREPRGPDPSARRDAASRRAPRHRVGQIYRRASPTISERAPSEHANASDVSQIGAAQ